ncbi:MAG: Gfo/Idh/MocA family oxidoreductase, partial [Thermomicrobiales bacterium]
MISSPLSVAIVGCGVIGLHHAKVIAEHPRFSVSGLIDPRPAALDAVRSTLPEG